MKFISNLGLAVVALLALTDDGSAAWRRCPWRRAVSPCVVVVPHQDPRLRTEKRDIPEFTETPEFRLGVRAWKEPDADTFTVQHHDRGRAKTTFADAPVEFFAGLGSLIVSLPPDEYMAQVTQTDWDFDRIPEEVRNVQVTGYLFAVKKESDNDYHLVIDDDGFLDEGAK